MAENFDLIKMKRVGFIQQKQKEYFALRLRTVGGDLTSEQLRKIAYVADKYGEKFAHLSTRQGVEIHGVHHTSLEKAKEELSAAGIEMGACGPRIRIVVACPGAATCKWGVIDTKSVATYLDNTYFRKDTPHKFKLGVTGCPHNCAKASENDVGVMGAILPVWYKDECINCDLCINICPGNAISKVNDEFVLDEGQCINCSLCSSSCPTSAWKPDYKGFNLLVGGTMGKMPRLGSVLKKLIKTNQELYDLIDRSIEYYRANGRKKERFGHMIDRIGLEKVKDDILNGRI